MAAVKYPIPDAIQQDLDESLEKGVYMEIEVDDPASEALETRKRLSNIYAGRRGARFEYKLIKRDGKYFLKYRMIARRRRAK